VAYTLKPGRSIGYEVRRTVRKQIGLAIDKLRESNGIHDARRHVKKARATIRMVRTGMPSIYEGTNRRLRRASRLLAPIADCESSVRTLDRLRRKYRRHLSPQTFSKIRRDLLERSALVVRKTKLTRAVPRAIRILTAERARAAGWNLTLDRFRHVGAGLQRTFRRARTSMARAQAAPTAKHYHAWRQRVKDLWFQVRLVEGWCGGRLQSLQRRLEVLDGWLDEFHNVALLEHVLVEEPLASRAQTARYLRLLREYRSGLSSRTRMLGNAIFAQKPKQFRRRIRRLWRSTAAASRNERNPWRRAA
jgi:hypothetical protein